MICPHCDKRIGYETRYYTVEPGKSDAPRDGLVLAHALCEEMAARVPYREI